MKKLFMILMSILVMLVAYLLNRGSLAVLLLPTAIIPLILGSLFTTMFSFRWAEITETFRGAFSQGTDFHKTKDYQKSLLVIKNLEAAITFWSITMVITAVIQILSSLSSPDKLGPSLAVACLTLLYGFGLRAALFVPMENSIKKKLLLSNDV